MNAARGAARPPTPPTFWAGGVEPRSPTLFSWRCWRSSTFSIICELGLTSDVYAYGKLFVELGEIAAKPFVCRHFRGAIPFATRRKFSSPSDHILVAAIAPNAPFIAGCRGLQLHNPKHTLLSQLSTGHLISALRRCHFGPPQD
jgi:hypothetical protein